MFVTLVTTAGVTTATCGCGWTVTDHARNAVLRMVTMHENGFGHVKPYDTTPTVWPVN